MTCQNRIRKAGGGYGHEELRVHKVNSTVKLASLPKDPALMHDEIARSSQFNYKKKKAQSTVCGNTHNRPF